MLWLYPQAWKGWMRECFEAEVAVGLQDRAWFWAPEEPGLESRLCLLQVACPQLRSLSLGDPSHKWENIHLWTLTEMWFKIKENAYEAYEKKPAEGMEYMISE